MNGAGAGRYFGRHELRGVLGEGGLATVYRADDPALGREVALKALVAILVTDPSLRPGNIVLVVQTDRPVRPCFVAGRMLACMRTFRMRHIVPLPLVTAGP